MRRRATGRRAGQHPQPQPQGDQHRHHRDRDGQRDVVGPAHGASVGPRLGVPVEAVVPLPETRPAGSRSTPSGAQTARTRLERPHPWRRLCADAPRLCMSCGAQGPSRASRLAPWRLPSARFTSGRSRRGCIRSWTTGGGLGTPLGAYVCTGPSALPCYRGLTVAESVGGSTTDVQDGEAVCPVPWCRRHMRLTLRSRARTPARGRRGSDGAARPGALMARNSSPRGPASMNLW